MRSTTVTVLAILILASSATLCHSQLSPPSLSKMDQTLTALCRNGPPDTPVRIVVQTRPGELSAVLRDFAELGGTVRTKFSIIDGFAGAVPGRRLERLAALPGVTRISSDAGVRKMLDTAAPAVGAAVAWQQYGVTGHGVTVAVIDSGINLNNDLVAPDRALPPSSIDAEIAAEIAQKHAEQTARKAEHEAAKLVEAEQALEAAKAADKSAADAAGQAKKARDQAVSAADDAVKASAEAAKKAAAAAAAVKTAEQALKDAAKVLADAQKAAESAQAASQAAAAEAARLGQEAQPYLDKAAQAKQEWEAAKKAGEDQKACDKAKAKYEAAQADADKAWARAAAALKAAKEAADALVAALKTATSAADKVASCQASLTAAQAAALAASDAANAAESAINASKDAAAAAQKAYEIAARVAEKADKAVVDAKSKRDAQDAKSGEARREADAAAKAARDAQDALAAAVKAEDQWTWWGDAGLEGGRLLGGYDWVANKEIVANNDQCGHGTHIAGVIGSTALMTRWPKNREALKQADPDRFAREVAKHDLQYWRDFAGVAPRVNLVNCRVLDKNGLGYVSDVIAALEWCISHKDQYGIRIANLSLGRPVGESHDTDPLCLACDRAWRAGIVIVASGGNWGYEGYSTIFSPGNTPCVITVGAVDDYGTVTRDDDEISGYSARGPSPIDHVVKPDIVAPGNRVTSLRVKDSGLDKAYGDTNIVPLDYYTTRTEGRDRVKDSQYFVLSGTSMAAAIVSGACALVLEQDPSLTPDTVKTRLMLSADPSPQYSALWQGAGYLNIPEALTCTVKSIDTALSPVALETTEGDWCISPVPVMVAGDNLCWEPTPRPKPPSAGSLPPAPVSVNGDNLAWEPVYPVPPKQEVYQPAKDPAWGGYTGYGWWPQYVCAVDTSPIAGYGEDFAIYLHKHGPKPPKK